MSDITPYKSQEGFVIHPVRRGFEDIRKLYEVLLNIVSHNYYEKSLTELTYPSLTNNASAINVRRSTSAT